MKKAGFSCLFSEIFEKRLDLDPGSRCIVRPEVIKNEN
jgi:hypothetical protein